MPFVPGMSVSLVADVDGHFVPKLRMVLGQTGPSWGRQDL